MSRNGRASTPADDSSSDLHFILSIMTCRPKCRDAFLRKHSFRREPAPASPNRPNSHNWLSPHSHNPAPEILRMFARLLRTPGRMPLVGARVRSQLRWPGHLPRTTVREKGLRSERDMFTTPFSHTCRVIH